MTQRSITNHWWLIDSSVPMGGTCTKCHYTHHSLLPTFLLITNDSVSFNRLVMKYQPLCRWVLSVPDRTTRNFPFLPVLLIKDVLFQRILSSVESCIASLSVQRSHFQQLVPSPVPSSCPIHPTVNSSWAVLTEARCNCHIIPFYHPAPL